MLNLGVERPAGSATRGLRLPSQHTASEMPNKSLFRRQFSAASPKPGLGGIEIRGLRSLSVAPRLG